MPEKKSNSSTTKTPAWKEPMQDVVRERLDTQVTPKLDQISALLQIEEPEREPGELTAMELMQTLADTQIKILNETGALRAEVEDIKNILRQLAYG